MRKKFMNQNDYLNKYYYVKLGKCTSEKRVTYIVTFKYVVNQSIEGRKYHSKHKIFIVDKKIAAV